MKVEVVDSEDGFDSLRDEWNALVSRLELPSPFQSWEWQRGWWRHFADTKLDNLRLLLFRRAGVLVGIAPMQDRKRFGVRQLTTLGWRDRITEQGVLLFPRADRAALLDELWNWLSAQPWTWVGLPQLNVSDALPAAAASHMVSSDEIVFEYLALPPTWESLEGGLSRSMRGNLRYYPSLVAREGHDSSFESVTSPQRLAAALPVLFDLHTARAAVRTAIRHRDYLKPPRRRAFLLEVAPRLAALGEAGIGLLRIHGEVVAAQLWLERDRALFLYYSGFNPSWARYSVGMLNTAQILRHAMARGVERVEFLRGANSYKSRWGTQARIEADVVLARRRRLVRAQESYRVRAKRLARRVERWRTRVPRISFLGRQSD